MLAKARSGFRLARGMARRNMVRTFLIKMRIAGRFDADRALVLTSSPRSGSTVLGDVLTAIPDSCVLFEPLHLDRVPGARALHFTWRTYVDPATEWPEGKAFFKRVFEGRVINRWTVNEMSIRDAWASQRLIVKFVRANRLLPWLCKTFKLPPPILLLRHPCAVVASQLSLPPWQNPQRPDGPPFLDPFPGFQAALARTETREELLAAQWALDQLAPLLRDPPVPWTILTYEELVLRPEPVLDKIAKSWGQDLDRDIALSRLNKPSRVTSSSGVSGVAGWRERLTAEQVERILGTVRSLGLTFYGEDDEADYGLLYDGRLGERIRKVGVG